MRASRSGSALDNLTHTLLGLGLSRAGLGRLDPLAPATLVVAANLPDADLVVQAIGGPLAYLHYHRGITHAAIGIAAEALVLAGVMTAIARGGRERFLPLLVAAAVGLLSHPLLDLLNTYGVRPWLPFDGARYYGDAAFILDPWLWLTLGAGACLAAPRTHRAHVRWAGLAATALVLIVYSGRAPIGVSIAWAGGAALVAVLRAAGVGDARPRAAAASGLLAAAAYVGVLFACSHVALERGVAAIAARLPAGERIVATSAHPRPAIPWRFDALVQTGTGVHRAAVNLLSGEVGPTRSIATRLDDPLLSRVRDTYAHEVWRDFARHPFVARNEDGSLILGDARYQPKAVVDWCNIPVAVPDP